MALPKATLTLSVVPAPALAARILAPSSVLGPLAGNSAAVRAAVAMATVTGAAEPENDVALRTDDLAQKHGHADPPARHAGQASTSRDQMERVQGEARFGVADLERVWGHSQTLFLLLQAYPTCHFPSLAGLGKSVGPYAAGNTTRAGLDWPAALPAAEAPEPDPPAAAGPHPPT